MKLRIGAWAPAAVLSVGIVATFGGVNQQRAMPLRAPLATTIPVKMAGFPSTNVPIPQEERRVAGMDSYVMRTYGPVGAPEQAAFSVYVGYYRVQSQGNTIHSPKNCLPGAGWEPLTSTRERIDSPIGSVPVNRYLLQNGTHRALVLYWYQGRGRVVASEYLVKWNLLRDKALLGRSDEALVRIVVPVGEQGEEAAHELAVRVADQLLPAVKTALPARRE